jgi:mono/diheme cytochrome c family protein
MKSERVADPLASLRPAPGPAARVARVAILFAGAAMGMMACSAPGGPDSVTSWSWGPDAGAAGTGTTPVASSALTCTPAQGSLSLPARSSVMAAGATSGDTKVFTEDLFNLFQGTCGGCHVAASLGNFHVSSLTFSKVVDQTALGLIQSDDPTKYMPPAGAGGAAYSSRSPNDPIVLLATLMSQWIAQGRPDALFTVPSSAPASADSYALSPDVGMRLTNIGDCVPSKSIVASSAQTMDALDAFFASATQLPDTLDQTDLTTLDSTALAQLGVISYAPQYPLWTDDAGKQRYIRVPRGQSVTFDEATQKFTIPPNTRFYKTFLKKVVDGEGNERYRKLETRVIVSRPDQQLPDGTAAQEALFGTYLWSDDEMTASLSNVPLNDHTGFTDRLIEYTLDEPREQTIVDTTPPAQLTYAIEFGTTGLKRHYAIPGSPRCIQCHMGSPGQNFVLGFIPLQIARRPDGTGGSYETTGPDELTQLQRFIDYGVITGMASPADVTLLEDSEGTRKPRNAQELQAQAYMLGNCAHCHNPRGYPSVKSPALADVLNFMPSDAGGVFQFPLDRMSPLRTRGIDQDVPIPYLTPSLREYPVASEPTPNWTPKWVTCQTSSDPSVNLLCQGKTSGTAHLSAPWRSLLYRNVDTPFMYADDLAIFPHMPMNSPGYDCRVAPMMGDWMVSIPAARKNPGIDEDAVPAGTGVVVDDNPQPYVEVLPGDPAYATALTDAQARLTEYHSGLRYGFCPDQTDIVDPAVIAAGGGYPLVPVADVVPDPAHPGQIIQPNVGVPVRAHFVVTDLTDPLGDWYPRRSTWDQVLVKDVVDMSDLPVSADTQALELEARQNVLDEIELSTLTPELRTFVETEVPFGLWQANPSCTFASIPRVADIPVASRPEWMIAAAPPETAPVYMQSPGSAVFMNICINCHGPEADSQGLLADALSNMTGGTGRVANFRHGLFGPEQTPGANRVRVFGPFATQTPPVTGDDWAARYMAWMALGGTLVHVPDALLNIVATTPVVGVRRSHHLAATISPNMLKLAQALCAQALIPADVGDSPKLDDFFFSHGHFDWGDQTGLIDANGDAQMWQTLCSMGNRTVVRVPWVVDWSTVAEVAPSIIPFQSLYYGDNGAYPATAPVLDDRGHVTMGIQPDNTFPMCFRRPTDPKQQALSDQYLAAHPIGGPGGVTIPYCPDSLFADSTSQLESTQNDMIPGGYDLIGADKWAARGAINAGFAVFLYLDKLTNGEVTPKVPYNHCP